MRDQIVARWDRLDQPSYTGFVMPELNCIKNARGQIQDVTIFYPRDLETQMLEWAGRK